MELELYNMDDLDSVNFSDDSYDYFMLAGGADSRAYKVLRKIENKGIRIDNLLVFEFIERKENSAPKESQSHQEYKGFVQNIHKISCSIMDPSKCIKSLTSGTFNFYNTQKVAIDISCLTKPYFFSILKYFNEHTKLKTVTIFYTEPRHYIFTKTSLYNSFHGSYGPLTVNEIPGFPGNDINTNTKILVILLGFDADLSRTVSDEIAPNEIIVINGFPPYFPKFKDISITNNERLIESGVSSSIRYAAANSPFETFNALERIKKENPKGFINIAPLGTKPMALGACLFAVRYPSTRVIYPLPERYAKITTRECSTSWKYEIPLKI